MFGILRSVPSGWRNDSIGSSSAMIAEAARLYPHIFCFDLWIAAKSRSRAASLPFMSRSGPARVINYYCGL